MDALILAAGYAKERLPHVKNVPKPLLPVAGKPIVEHIVDNLIRAGMDKITVLTNEIYLSSFENWRESWRNKGNSKEIILRSDNTKSYQGRLGAIGDLEFYLSKLEERFTPSQLLVVAGDNFFDFKMEDMIQFWMKDKHSSVVALYDIKDLGKASEFGVVKLSDEGETLIDFKEKPSSPASTLVSTLCYILCDKELHLVRKFPSQGCVREAGQFMEWLVGLPQGRKVRGFIIKGADWVDVGQYEEYRRLNQTKLLFRLEHEPNFRQSTEAIILFADIIGAATISEYISESEYDDFISEFQEIALRVIEEKLDEYGAEDRHFVDYAVNGDEAFFILYTKDQVRDVRTVLDTAIELKRKCFLSKFNHHRRGKSFYDIGIGIHCGNVVLKAHPSARRSSRRFNAEGYSINLAKRIEGWSRKGSYSKIMLSKRVLDICPKPISMVLSDRIDVPLDGIYGSKAIYELQVYGTIEDPETAKPINPRDIEYYVSALENSAHDMWLLLWVARYYYDQEDYSRALGYYKDAVERYPDFADGFVYLGRAYYRLNRFQEAKKYLSQAIQLNPLSGAARAHNFLAVTLRRLREYEAAVEHHEMAIKSEERTPAYYFNAYAYTIADAHSDGRVFSHPEARTFDLDKALKYLEQAGMIFEAEQKREAHEYLLEHTRGYIYLMKGHFERAAIHFEKVIELLSSNSQFMPNKIESKVLEAYFHKGLALERQGNVRSRECFLKSLDVSDSADQDRVQYYWISEAKQKASASHARQATTAL